VRHRPVTAATSPGRPESAPSQFGDPEARPRWPQRRRESEHHRRQRLLNELAVLNERLRGGSPAEVARTRAKVEWLQRRSRRNWELITQYVKSSDGAVTLSLIEAANNKARGGRNEALTSGALGKADNIARGSAALSGLGDTKTAALLHVQRVAPVRVLAACRYTSARVPDRSACTWQVVQALRDEARESVTVSDLVAQLQRLQSQLSATHERAHNLVRAQPGRVEHPRA
jgi:hypothetical protein